MTKQIVAFGGGGFSMEAGNPLLDDYVLNLARARADGQPPRVCFLPTASGDADHYIVRYYRAFGDRGCIPSHLTLFRRDKHAPYDPHGQLLGADLIYVGGGSVQSMLGAWRAHGLDDILRAAYEQGTILCGLSAGSLCWFEQAVSTFHGPRAVIDAIGLLPGSNTVHYGNEPARRGAYEQTLREGGLPGYAAADGCALHFVDGQLHQAVSSRKDAGGWRCSISADGEFVEDPLDVRYLGNETDIAPEPDDHGVHEFREEMQRRHH